MTKIELAKQYCLQEPVLYAAFLYALDEPEAELLYADTDGVMLRLGWVEFISAQSAHAMDAMLPKIQGTDVVAFEERFEAPLQALGIKPELICYSCLYDQDVPLSVTLPAGVTIERLDHSWDDFVYRHYSHADGEPDYVAERIEAGMFGLFENGSLAGFIGTHSTGEMGLLEILPAYRRKGYARLLEAALINERLKAHRLPYGHVQTHNAASLALQKSLGMRISKRSCVWYVRQV